MKTAQQILIFVSGHDSAKSAKIKSNAPRSARGNGKCDIARSRTMSSRNHIPTQTSETYPTKLFQLYIIQLYQLVINFITLHKHTIRKRPGLEERPQAPL